MRPRRKMFRKKCPKVMPIEQENNNDSQQNCEKRIPLLLEKMNKEFAIIALKNGVRILREVHDPKTKQTELQFWKRSDLVNWLKDREPIQIRGNSHTTNVAELWLNYEHRRKYDKIVFMPEGEPGANCYNLWRGWAIKPKNGDCNLFLRHIRQVICRGNKRLYKYVLNWMAYAVQHPARRPEVALVLQGRQGAGKGIFVRGFGRLFGPHFIHVHNRGQLLGRFNQHLLNCILLFADEHAWDREQDAKGLLKTLITEPTRQIEPKGVDQFTVANNVHLILASNEDWVVPAGEDERRYCVIKVSSRKIGDHQYFRKLQIHLKQGGTAALLYLLQHRDIRGFNPRQFPITKALAEQKLRTLNTLGKFWHDCLDAGHISNERYWGEVAIDELYERYIEHAKNLGESGRDSKMAVGRSLLKLCPKMKRKRKVVENMSAGKRRKEQKWFYVFPSLENCRHAFEKFLNVGLDWT